MRKIARVIAVGLVALVASLFVAFTLSGGAPASAGDVTIQVAIDVNTAGNGDNVLGSTESCNAAPLQVGDTIDVDIVVRGVPAYVPNQHTGIQGFDMDFQFDPAVVQVTNVQSFRGPTILKAPGPGVPPYFDYIDYNYHTQFAPPGVTGDTYVGMVSFSNKSVGGEGVLVRITLKAIGAGRARMTTRYTLNSDLAPAIYDASGVQQTYAVSQSDATLVAGSGNCAAPTPTTYPFVTQSPGPTPATSPTPLPTQNPHPPVVQTAIDLDTQGNGDHVLGLTESCNAVPLALGSTIDIDVVVRGVPAFEPNTPYTGIRGFEFDLSFDEAILHVTNVAGFEGPNIFNSAGVPSRQSQISYNYPSDSTPPGDTGDTYVFLGSDSGELTDGDGVLTRITLEAIHPGVSRLSLGQSTVNKSVPGIYESTLLLEYAVDNTDAAIVVGTGDCSSLPTPTATPVHFPPTFVPTPPRTTPTRRPTPTPSFTGAPTATPTSTVAATDGPTITPRKLPDSGGPRDVDSSSAYWIAGPLGVILAVGGAFVFARRRL